MAADAAARPTPVAYEPTLRARAVGLGTVFGKTLRDSRRAVAIVGLVTGLLLVLSAAGLAAQFATAASRAQLVAQAELLPVALRGLLGEPIAVDRLGGFLSWRVGNSLPPMLGIWSVLALSGTLGGEAGRGSLDLLVATPVSRRRIASEKLLAHVAGVGAAMLAAAILTWLGGLAFSRLPGDEIGLGAALAHFSLTGLLMLLAGSVAFAVAPVVGRGRAAAAGFVVLFAGYLIPSYAELSSAIAAVEPLSPFSWTAGHRPLGGRYDWPPLGALALLIVLLGGAGVLAFERRDLGQAAALRWLRLPSPPPGTANPFARQLFDRLGPAVAWGAGIGLYGALIAASAEGLSESLGQLPGIRQMIERVYPGVDITAPSGVLQLAFFGFASLLGGLGAASLVGGWSGDEVRRRLDLVLSAPVARRRWALATGLALLVAVAVLAATVAALIALAVASAGGDAVTPAAGLAMLALYGAAIVGIGFAVGGLVRADLAGLVAGAVVIGSYLLELIGNVLRLPDWVLALSLNHHLGQPLVGRFDETGVALYAALAVGGLALGTWGLGRRDLRG